MGFSRTGQPALRMCQIALLVPCLLHIEAHETDFLDSPFGLFELLSLLCHGTLEDGPPSCNVLMQTIRGPSRVQDSTWPGKGDRCSFDREEESMKERRSMGNAVSTVPRWWECGKRSLTSEMHAPVSEHRLAASHHLPRPIRHIAAMQANEEKQPKCRTASSRFEGAGHDIILSDEQEGSGSWHPARLTPYLTSDGCSSTKAANRVRARK